MSALLFGSISTVADTSEMQREAFNQAFDVHGLGWHWDRDDYIATLDSNGGQNRVAAYADKVGQVVDAKAIHQTKSEIFQNNLTKSEIAPRPGVVEAIAQAKSSGLKVALVTTTSRENIAALTEALRSSLPFADFDLIVDSSNVQKPKPDAAAYTYALQTLGESAADCVAIEDNVGGVHAAVSAQINCVAFPNANTSRQDFTQARTTVQQLDFDDLRELTSAK